VFVSVTAGPHPSGGLADFNLNYRAEAAAYGIINWASEHPHQAFVDHGPRTVGAMETHVPPKDMKSGTNKIAGFSENGPRFSENFPGK
jgi:hypothetical protein